MACRHQPDLPEALPSVRTSLSAPIALAVLVTAPCAQAQRAADPPAAPASSASASAPTPDVTLPTIKATAAAISQLSPLGSLSRRSDEGALGSKTFPDTPFSVTVVGSEEIVLRGAKSIRQIFFNDPSVYTPTTSLSTDRWATQIRGLGVRNAYVDDVPMLLHWGGDFPTEVAMGVTARDAQSRSRAIKTVFQQGVRFTERSNFADSNSRRPSGQPPSSIELG